MNLSPLRFDVTTPEREPLGGTESCVAYLATRMAGAHDVSLLAYTPAATIRSVRHLNLQDNPTREFFREERFDVIIQTGGAAQLPQVRGLSPQSRLIFWCHEAPDQASMQPFTHPEVLRSLDALVFVSPWQRSQVQARFRLWVPSRVIGNGLTPSFEGLFRDRQELLAAKTLCGAYTSTPRRGLEVLLEAQAKLTVPLQLEIFSSMHVYRQDDAPFEGLYQRARARPSVRYHGSVSQTRLAAAMRPVSFLTYPCIYPETYCIAAIEAMAAGATVVATDLAALRSTTLGYGELMPLNSVSVPALSAAYAQFLARCMAAANQSPEAWAEKMLDQIATVNRECTWRRRAGDWEALLMSLVQAPQPASAADSTAAVPIRSG